MTALRVRSVKVDRLVPDPENARTHSPENLEAIAKSLEHFGQRKPIVVARASDGSNRLVVIAGNGTLEAAIGLGWSELAVAEVPEEWDADRARAYAIADNRSAELAEWDKVQLASALVDLDAVGWNIKDLGFTSLGDDGLEPAGGQDDSVGHDGNAYTAAINVPQYEVVGDQPGVFELYDDTRAKDLQRSILAADIPAEVAEFLLLATHRHVRFNYRKLAEYYPHATPEVQRLMEESALVIVDAEDAIRWGYARFMATVEELRAEDLDES